MMSKKNYIRAAQIVRDEPFSYDRETTIERKLWVRDAFIALFKNDNPRFDEARFVDACNVQQTIANGLRLPRKTS